MKNELIVASRQRTSQGRVQYNKNAAQRLNELLDTFGLDELHERFFTPGTATEIIR